MPVTRLDITAGFGISQSGRFLRHYLYENLNHDKAERIVFDGVMQRSAQRYTLYTRGTDTVR